jgi:hypothetical protein
VAVRAADEAQRLIAGCRRIVELERADFEPYCGVMSVAGPKRGWLAAELEVRSRLHDAVDDIRAPFERSDACSAIPHMRAVGIDPAHLTEMYAHTVETAPGHYTHALGCSFASARTEVRW